MRSRETFTGSSGTAATNTDGSCDNLPYRAVFKLTDNNPLVLSRSSHERIPVSRKQSCRKLRYRQHRFGPVVGEFHLEGVQEEGGLGVMAHHRR